MDPIAALDASAARVVQLVGQVDRSQWSRATPCADWNVRELVGHLIATMLGHVDLLHGAPASDLATLIQQQALAGGNDLLTAVADAATAVRAAFTEPGALERTVHHFIGDVPGSRLLDIRTTENVLHGWDLSTALGLPATIDDALADHVYQYLAPRAELLPSTGYYAPPKRTPATDAGVQERLLALAGR
ncbi:TIGR03086 family metal-binding protein [Modestobacter excelsi]|uniref:TIGR03086 family metal-binding protein n=1 Tax=Modestobacter excelsi TaxID=2213161 RepID=UPI001C20D784|nr:TIGR03086 family metal-binding protein [Modestobacter excelsi]